MMFVENPYTKKLNPLEPFGPRGFWTVRLLAPCRRMALIANPLAASRSALAAYGFWARYHSGFLTA